MKYYFTEKERSAIIKVAITMEGVDGKETKEETLLNFKVFDLIGVNNEDIDKAQSMSILDSMFIIKNMLPNEKKFVCSYLATIMCVDKDINDKELALWKLISQMCEFPSMHLTEALKFFRDNILH